MAKVYAAYRELPAEALSKDSRAMAIGQRLFINNCATCHGSDARGSKGFPDLTDRDWLHGGTPEKIEETITLGRTGSMPPMAMAVGTSQDVHNVAHYVLSLSASPHDSIAAAAGKSKFTACAACHGVDGKGNPALGAPNLTDKVWLHGWGEDAIADIVNRGKTNVMPRRAGACCPSRSTCSRPTSGACRSRASSRRSEDGASARATMDPVRPVRPGVIPIVAVPGAAASAAPLYISETKIQPRSVHGWFATWRWTLVWFTQLLFYGLPVADVERAARGAARSGGAPLLHLRHGPASAGRDLPRRAADRLGVRPVPLHRVAGRLWCGFACPQTVYTEIFMWVERRFEGDRQAR
jgi:mono/diheme cytochrome c family protein